jgi:hypothetical protein
MTNKDLQKQFERLDKLFFDSRLEGLRVRFVDLNEEGANGMYMGNEIQIDKRLRHTDGPVIITLLHEMIHADMPKYIGYPADGGHGMLFQSRLVELFQMGAYDGVL